MQLHFLQLTPRLRDDGAVVAEKMEKAEPEILLLQKCLNQEVVEVDSHKSSK